MLTSPSPSPSSVGIAPAPPRWRPGVLGRSCRLSAAASVSLGRGRRRRCRRWIGRASSLSLPQAASSNSADRPERRDQTSCSHSVSPPCRGGSDVPAQREVPRRGWPGEGHGLAHSNGRRAGRSAPWRSSHSSVGEAGADPRLGPEVLHVDHRRRRARHRAGSGVARRGSSTLMRSGRTARPSASTFEVPTKLATNGRRALVDLLRACRPVRPGPD